MGRISVIVVCHNRRAELCDCLASILRQTPPPDEILVVDNGSTDGTAELFAAGGKCAHPAVSYVGSATNLGVAGGRNLGIRRATGETLLFVDDDAILEPADAIGRIVRRFGEDATVGVLAFKVVNPATGTIRREEFPHTNKDLDPDTEFETTYFIGAGHAIRREVFATCGLYPEDFFYGMEELDLSFRAIDRGFRIVYFPDAAVRHGCSPRGRLTDERKWVYRLNNRLAISYKYLKARHLAVTALVWFAAIWRASGSLVVPLKGLSAFRRRRGRLVREPLSGATIAKISRLRGRVWY